MLKQVLFFAALFTSVFVKAQYKVTFKIIQLPDYHQSSDFVYVAGSFNNWNPSQKEAAFQKDKNGFLEISTVVPKGKLEYKITRGNWEKGESGAAGMPMQNRVTEVLSDTIIHVSVLHWADHFPKTPKQSTASANVKIIETHFYIPQLNRYRRIWIYLPPGYAKSKIKYPVLYMHDGQNVFEDTTAYSGEWGVDEALDTLNKKTTQMIIVAVDNGGDKRLNEYSPYNMERFGKGEGDAYIDFLVNTLRPYINKNYRTKRCGKHNFIAGSSMGGLISFYALLKHPKKWGGAGVFSPAFWIVPSLKNNLAKKSKKIKSKIYFYAGKQESIEMVPDLLAVFSQLNVHSKAKLKTVIRSEGAHNEATWRKEFPLFYSWITAQ